MNPIRLFAFALVFAISLFAQTVAREAGVTPSSSPTLPQLDGLASTITKDPAAVALIQRSLAAMRNSAVITPLSDSISTGILKVQGDELPVTIKTKGTTLVRIEVQTKKGLNVRIVNNDRGVMRRTGHADRTLSIGTIAVERVSHIPAFSFLNEYSNAGVQVAAAVANPKANTTSIALKLSTLAGWPPQRQMPYCEFEFDANTNLVSKMRSPAWDEDGNDDPVIVETIFSDYRTVDGVAVPFTQSLSVDGAQVSQLVLTSVRFNIGISVSEFDLEAK